MDPKHALRNATNELIQNGFKPDGIKKYAKIVERIINQDLIKTWSSYQKIEIVVGKRIASGNMEFLTPKFDQSFVGRYVNGHESMGGFLHSNPSIRMVISPDAFTTIKHENDGFNFFKSAIKFYESGSEPIASQIHTSVMKLDNSTRHLIATGKLSGVITLSLKAMFVFNNIDMSSTAQFKPDKSDIRAITTFIKRIGSSYASPEKEQAKIVKDLKNIINAFNESGFAEEDHIALKQFVENVQLFIDGKYKQEMAESRATFESSLIDHTRCSNRTIYLEEASRVKKLKKIPRDLVSYITISTEEIETANDKMMISSYCLGKLEIVEWYIELLDAGSKKYIVPHTRPYLESVRTQLLACFKKIMEVKIVKPGKRPIIDIEYPDKYKG